MSQHLNLQNLYRHPGFLPQATLSILDFDLEAVGLRLTRRRKKQSAESVDVSIATSMISNRVGSATSIVRIDASTWNCPSDGFSVVIARL
jgi:hypothetical protein